MAKRNLTQIKTLDTVIAQEGIRITFDDWLGEYIAVCGHGWSERREYGKTKREAVYNVLNRPYALAGGGWG